MRLARHLVEDELELRGQAQTGLGAHHGAQASLGLVERLLGALAFALLMAVPAQRGPVDLGELEIIGHLDVGDRHVLESLVVQRGFHIRGDHTLDERRDAGGARIGSLHGVPYCLTSYAVLLFNTSRKPPCALGENGRRRSRVGYGRLPALLARNLRIADYLRSISRISKVSMTSPISMSLKLPRLMPAS